MKKKETRHHHLLISLASLTALLVPLFLQGGLLQPREAVGAPITCSSGVSGCHFKVAVLDGATRNQPQGLFPGSHARHSGYSTSSAKRQYQYACSICHPSSGYSNAHQTGFKNITGSSLPGTSYTPGKKIPNTDTPTFGNCSQIYCHSTGRAAGMGQVRYSSARWGGTKNCLGCHGGRASATGAPARSIGNFTLTTTHSQHLKYPAANMNCQMCHSKTTQTNAWTLKTYTAASKHVNGVANVTFTDVAYGNYTSYKTSGVEKSKCTNVACHGGKTRSAWSATVQNTNHTCTHCHGTASGVGTGNTNRNYYAPGYNGGTSTDGIAAATDMRVGGHFVHLTSVYMKKLKCNECHTVPSNPFDGTHMTGPRYSSQSINFGQASTAIKNTTTPAFTSGTAVAPATCTTTYCHGSKMPKNDTGGTDKSPTWNANLTTGTPGTAECARCHGNPPLFGSSSSAHIGSTATTSCIGCHKSVASATGSIVNKDLHVNGSVNMFVDTTITSSCNKCHGNPPVLLKYGRYSGLVKTPKTLALGASPANVGAHQKHKDSGLTCNVCHNNSNAGGHPDSTMQIDFIANSTTWPAWNAGSPAFTYGSYSGNNPTGGTIVAQSAGGTTVVRATTNNTNNSCNTYCHGGWSNSNRNMNPRWTSGTAATACGACHGSTALTPPLVGTHARHAGYSSVLTARQGYTFACTKCHPSRMAGNHIKGTVHVRFSTAVLGTSAAYTKAGATQTDAALPNFTWSSNKLAGDTPDGTCSNIACHSTGRGAGMGTNKYTTTQQWGNTTRNCLGCHAGRASATGAPARSSANFTLSTTHSQHLKYPAANINCQTCHAKVATNAATLKNFTGAKLHADGVRNIAFGGVLYGSYTSYKTSGVNQNKCTNISCHGGKSRGVWSATVQNNDNSCVHCHGVAGTSSALPNTAANRKFFAPGWNGSGISTDGISVNTDVRVGAHFVHLSSVYLPKLKCNECHTVPSSPFDGSHMATTRFNSQSLAFGQASTATRNSVTPAFTAGGAATPATCTTTFCHGSSMPKGDTSGTDRSPAWNANLTTGTPGTAECARCHGNPPTAGTTAATHSGKTATTSCVTCHGMVVNGSGAIINKGLHMNGTVQYVSDCNSCHGYDNVGASWTSGIAGGGGSGAHYKHLVFIKARLAIGSLTPAGQTFGLGEPAAVCGTCHTNTIAQHDNGSRQITFGAGGTTNTMGAGTANSMSLVFGGSNPAASGTTNVNMSCSNLMCHYAVTPNWY